MKKVAVIVEGQGDVTAISSLIAKTGKLFGETIIASDPPIRGGEARKLRRQGELERMLRMATSRPDAEEVLVLVDLDDDCPAQFHAEFTARAQAIAEQCGKPIRFCFCVREYEAWFLADLDTLRAALPDYGWTDDTFPAPEDIRGAKEALRRACHKGYKQSRDQLAFTKKIDIYRLALASRSFRKFVKSITNKSYEEIIEVSSSALAA